jgi:hypothetical protein
MYSRLTTLEMPSSWEGVAMGPALRTSPIYSHFDTFRTLIIPELAFPDWHTSMLPTSLINLMILVDCEEESVNHLIGILYKVPLVPTSNLTNLRSIHAYFKNSNSPRGW